MWCRKNCPGRNKYGKGLVLMIRGCRCRRWVGKMSSSSIQSHCDVFEGRIFDASSSKIMMGKEWVLAVISQIRGRDKVDKQNRMTAENNTIRDDLGDCVMVKKKKICSREILK